MISIIWIWFAFGKNLHTSFIKSRLIDTIKSKYTLLIDNPFYVGRQGDPDLNLLVNTLLVNNTNDTQRYIGTSCQYSKLYQVNNRNMIMIDDDCRGRSYKSLVIAPHRSAWTQLSFKFKKMPDTTFLFRIGMKVVKWKEKFRLRDPEGQALKQAGIVWSETEVFRTDRNHLMYGHTREEQMKLILKKPLPIYCHLTDNDKKKYVLSVNQSAVKKPIDTLIYKKRCVFTTFPLKLTNSSNEILRYINMTCSWEEIYKTDNDNLRILGHDCDSNFPHVITIEPHKSTVIQIPLVFNKGTIVRPFKFKMGMSLQKFIDNTQLFDFAPDVYMLRPETSNLIWSNEVEIP